LFNFFFFMFRRDMLSFALFSGGYVVFFIIVMERKGKERKGKERKGKERKGTLLYTTPSPPDSGLDSVSAGGVG
ncbi:hypothetical protein, partial [Gilvimarinus sp. 1_MG-2023]|uniref:hypothetical protein n=1 Tax=Gilvimarinus sp. 1_MG-2023 TaxID=3062638 RepID=UPI0026E315FC